MSAVLAVLMTILRPILESLVGELFGRIGDREEVETSTTDAIVLRPERSSVMTGRQKLDRMRKRIANLSAMKGEA